MIHISYFTT